MDEEPVVAKEGVIDQRMDAATLITKLQEFLEKNYFDQLLERVRKGEKSMPVDFAHVAAFDPELADYALDFPDDFLKGGEHAVEQLNLGSKVKGFVLRLRNLPPSGTLMVRNIRSAHINKLLCFDGVVRNKSEVRPQMTAAKFECPSCGNNHIILQVDNKFQEPTRCSCGRKGKFRLVSKELVDAQMMVLEEVPEQLEGGEQPKRMNVLLRNDLVSPLTEKRTNPGSRVRVVGMVKEVPIFLRTGGQSTKFDLFIDGNNLEPIEENFDEINIDPEELKQIKDLAKDPLLLKKIVNSMAPSIYGHEKTKEALALQLAGGVRKKRDDGIITRGDMHILLVGDPGAAKCITGESIVVLGDGYQKPIRDIVEPLLGSVRKRDVSNLGLSVATFDVDGKAARRRILAVSKRKARSIVTVLTEQGTKIRTTTNHPFFVLEDGLIVPKAAEDLTADDFVASPRFVDCSTCLQPLPQSVARSPARNAVHITLPPYCTEDVARFLGYLVGDGYCAYSPTSGWVTLTGNDVELLDDFTRIATTFGVRVTRRSSHKGKSAQEAYVTSRELVSYLESLSPHLLLGARRKTVPDCVLRSPNNVVVAFLQALFDCDGTVRRNRREVSFTSASRDLVENVRLLLRRFGISSQIIVKYQCATNSKMKFKEYYYYL
ncbi:hypothetical protein HY489_00005, partial [Candidatus Woesearchaeota archaeon]|nr:hypothetical protein [Candidatus Woesearchaeota archaeon]